jgi:hypothetical protein
VREVRYDGTADLEKLIGTSIFDIAWTFATGDVLFVDDEGLFNPAARSHLSRRRPAERLSGLSVGDCPAMRPLKWKLNRR